MFTHPFYAMFLTFKYLVKTKMYKATGATSSYSDGERYFVVNKNVYTTVYNSF